MWRHHYLGLSALLLTEEGGAGRFDSSNAARCVWVGGIDFDAGVADVEAMFAPCGIVVEVLFSYAHLYM